MTHGGAKQVRVTERNCDGAVSPHRETSDAPVLAMPKGAICGIHERHDILYEIRFVPPVRHAVGCARLVGPHTE